MESNRITGGKVLITGVSGIVGFHLAERLGRADPTREVVGIARSQNANVEDLSRLPNFRFVAGDVAAEGPWEGELRGAGLVYHLAAQSAVYRARQDPLGDLRNNVQGTLRLMLAAAASRVPRVIFTSGGAVYESQAYAREEQVGQPPSIYGAGKLAAEGYVRVVAEEAGLESTILRLARVYGPRMTRGVVCDLISGFRDRSAVALFAHPDSVFDLVYAKDVAASLEMASGEGWSGATVNVSSGQGVRLRDLHVALRETFGYEVPLLAGKGDPVVEVLVNERARALGWEPSHSLEDGMAETLRFFVPDLPLDRIAIP
jgi:UDP-glucose 4-epimerase